MHYGLCENGEYYLPVTIIPRVLVGCEKGAWPTRRVAPS